jgi:acyl-coenzyme A synthetase/AMP-(fatty) acid ligase
MARIYDELWFDFNPGDRQTVFIPLFYATGAVHGVHAGLMDGMTLIYKPKYDRFAFAKDLVETKAKIALVAPSHVATLEESGLQDNALSQLKYIFIGGEAIMPAAMEKFRKTFSNPWAAIAAGAALVAAGAVLTSLVNKASSASGASSAGSTYAAATVGGGSTLNLAGAPVYSGTAQEIRVTGTLKASGSQLVAVIENESKRKQLTT